MDCSKFCVRLLTVFTASVFFFNDSVDAGLILDPSQEQTVLDGNQDWDTVVGVSNLNLRFFGQTVQSLWIAENGNLNFSANDDYFTAPLGSTNIARVSPLWDDYLMIQTPAGDIDNRVSMGLVSGSYFSVTWQNMRLFNETTFGQPFPDSARSTQLVWFESDQSLRGFSFQRDDIAFAYQPHVAGTNDFGSDLYATVGLDSGTGRFAALPGTVAGQVTASNSQLIPGQANQFLLFRWNPSQGSYTVSVQQFTAVPESQYAFWLVATCSFAAALVARRPSRLALK